MVHGTEFAQVFGMKTTKSNVWLVVCLSVLTATAAFRASADQAGMAAKPAEKSYTGTVTVVDLNEQRLDVHGFFFSKKFNLGAPCSFTLPDETAGTLNDLRPGEKVTVSYQDASGVLVADRIEQQALTYEGMVKGIDAAKHTMTLHLGASDKEFQLPDDCKIILRNKQSGMLADIQPGSHVTVTYENPNGTLIARQIAQTSIEFTGSLTAIDLNERTVQAQATFGSKRFSLADNCAIVINGKADGELSDLKPKDKLVFSYNEIDGVNVVNRIAPAEAQANSEVVTQP